MYLDDVHDAGVGPFAMLLNYSDTTLKHAPDRRGRRTRFDEAAVNGQVNQGARVREIFGSAGTAVVFETSSVHRGMPARTGGRVTLTNYYHNDLPTCGLKRSDSAHASRTRGRGVARNGPRVIATPHE